MWSVGVIAFFCSHGYRPFSSKLVPFLIRKITNVEYEFDDKKICFEGKMFIKNCLTKYAFLRMTCKEALSHSWIKGFKVK